MKSLSISEVRKRLPDLADDVLRGQEVVVTRRGRPVMRLVPYREPAARAEDHPFRALPIRMADDFDEPREDLWHALEK